MRKNGFTIIEVIVVFLLILAVTCLVLPKSLNSTKQAKLISKWTEAYSQIEYVFSVIKAQNNGEIQNGLKNAENNHDRVKIVADTIKPFLRIKSEVDKKTYKQFYMNNTTTNEGDKYFVDDFFLTDAGEIVGLKWFTKDCSKETVCGIINFDVNGFEPPNKWGRDVFGVNVYTDRIEPIGKSIDINILKNDCTDWGQGIYCSNYYLIGGKFD